MTSSLSGPFFTFFSPSFFSLSQRKRERKSEREREAQLTTLQVLCALRERKQKFLWIDCPSCWSRPVQSPVVQSTAAPTGRGSYGLEVEGSPYSLHFSHTLDTHQEKSCDPLISQFLEFEFKLFTFTGDSLPVAASDS